MIQVWTKPHCSACTYTKKFLQANNIPFEEIDVNSDPIMASQLRELGQLEMPYVVTDDDSWSGYRREKLQGLLR